MFYKIKGGGILWSSPQTSAAHVSWIAARVVISARPSRSSARGKPVTDGMTVAPNGVATQAAHQRVSSAPSRPCLHIIVMWITAPFKGEHKGRVPP